MSAGSAFASGVRAGQAIWNNAIQNAMAGKRLDMLRTQFQFEQRQRKQAVENELAAQEAFQKFQSSIPTTDFDFKRKEDRDLYEKNMVEFYSDISRDPATLKQFEAYNKTMGIIGEADIANKIRVEQANIMATWKLNNTSMDVPMLKDADENSPDFGNLILDYSGNPIPDFAKMKRANFLYDLRQQREVAESKYGGGGMSQFFGSKPSELSPGLRERYIIDRKKFFDDVAKTGNNEKIVEASYVWGDAPSESALDSLDKYKFTTDRLSELSDLLKNESTGPMVGFWRKFKSGLGFDDKAALINAQITKIIPGLARGVFGEVGVLTDQDVAMYSKTIGNLNTPEEVNDALTKAAMDMVARGFESKLSTLAKNRKNVSGYLSQLKDVKSQSRELLGVEEPEIPVIEVESLPDSGAVTLSDEQAAAARAAAGPDGRVRVQQAGSDIIREINVNPPTEETVDEAPPPPVTPSAPEEDFSVWGSRHLEDFPPVSEEEQAAAPDRRSVLERRIEFLTATLENLPPDYTTTVNPYGPPSQIFNPDAAKRRKQLKDALRTTEEELNKL